MYYVTITTHCVVNLISSQVQYPPWLVTRSPLCADDLTTSHTNTHYLDSLKIQYINDALRAVYRSRYGTGIVNQNEYFTRTNNYFMFNLRDFFALYYAYFSTFYVTFFLHFSLHFLCIFSFSFIKLTLLYSRLLPNNFITFKRTAVK